MLLNCVFLQIAQVNNDLPIPLGICHVLSVMHLSGGLSIVSDQQQGRGRA